MKIIKDASRIEINDLVNRGSQKLVVDLVSGSMIRFHSLQQQAGVSVTHSMRSVDQLQGEIDDQEVTVERFT